jgi:hypothetical protein
MSLHLNYMTVDDVKYVSILTAETAVLPAVVHGPGLVGLA